MAKSTQAAYEYFSRVQLLRIATGLVPTHGFTRQALAQSVLALPEETHAEPLSDVAVTALFGSGDDARRTLINAWLQDGLTVMSTVDSAKPTVKDVLHARLRYNEPVLPLLPEVRLSVHRYACRLLTRILGVRPPRVIQSVTSGRSLSCPQACLSHCQRSLRNHAG